MEIRSRGSEHPWRKPPPHPEIDRRRRRTLALFLASGCSGPLRAPCGIQARGRVAETKAYNAAALVGSASEHGPVPSPREATGRASASRAEDFFAKRTSLRRGTDGRCTCPGGSAALCSERRAVVFRWQGTAFTPKEEKTGNCRGTQTKCKHALR